MLPLSKNSSFSIINALSYHIAELMEKKGNYHRCGKQTRRNEICTFHCGRRFIFKQRTAIKLFSHNYRQRDHNQKRKRRKWMPISDPLTFFYLPVESTGQNKSNQTHHQHKCKTNQLYYHSFSFSHATSSPIIIAAHCCLFNDKYYFR